jgi:AraC-like DNA-binding protein
MKQERLYLPFDIEFVTLEEYPKGSRHNSFFELIYIFSGTGMQYINQHKFNYRAGNLFLLTPQDVHSFEISSSTQFFFLRFNEYHIKATSGNEKDTIKRMEFILQNASHLPGCILKNKVDKPLIASLVGNIIQESSHQQLYHKKIIEQIVNAIITIVARNIALKLPKNIKENTGETVLDILHYIQENIFEPSRLRAEQISRHFGISLSYMGRYFKKQTGETLQQYLTNYKLRLVESRLLHSDMRIGEIAYEFNFVDESHLNRSFKKLKGVSPTEYRKQFC